MKSAAMTKSTSNPTATAAQSATATLEASPVWSILTNQHKNAIRALTWLASQDGAENGNLVIYHGLLKRFGADVGPIAITRIREDLEALKLIVGTGHDAERCAETFRLTWLSTNGLPEGNDFLAFDPVAWHAAKTARPLTASQQAIIDAIVTARTRPDLLDDADVKLLDSIEAMVRNGGRPSERQAWAVNAIRNRIIRGEKRVAPTAPASAAIKTTVAKAEAPAMPPIKHRERKAPRTKPTGKAITAPAATPTPPADTSVLPVHAIVMHQMHGCGVVVIAERGKSIVLFDYGQHVRVANDRLKIATGEQCGPM